MQTEQLISVKYLMNVLFKSAEISFLVYIEQDRNTKSVQTNPYDH